LEKKFEKEEMDSQMRVLGEGRGCLCEIKRARQSKFAEGREWR